MWNDSRHARGTRRHAGRKNMASTSSSYGVPNHATGQPSERSGQAALTRPGYYPVSTFVLCCDPPRAAPPVGKDQPQSASLVRSFPASRSDRFRATALPLRANCTKLGRTCLVPGRSLHPAGQVAITAARHRGPTARKPCRSLRFRDGRTPLPLVVWNSPRKHPTNVAARLC